MSQTAYNEQGIALVGQKANLGKSENVLSYALEVVAAIGSFVCLGTDKEKQVKLPVLTTDVTDIKAARGVMIHSHALESERDLLDPSYGIGRSVPVMTKGFVYVKVVEAVTPADAVAVRFGGAGAKGSFGKTITGGETVALPNARWITSAAIGGVAVLELL